MATPSFRPTRTQWFGRRSSNPTLADGIQEGDWWYRTDLNLFAYWDGANYHYWGGVGGIEFDGSQTTVYSAAGNYAITVSLGSPWAPSTINHVIDIQFNTNPVCDPGSPINIVNSPPVVGFTLVGLGAGTTLTTHVEALGW